MKSYPYIGQFQHAIKLFYGANRFILIEEGHGSNRHESKYTNITREYLQNTYGVVESKEHAEFIIGLAENAGLDVGTYSEKRDSYFYTGDDYTGFTDSESLASNLDEKLITIPLPPKQIQTAAQEEEFEMDRIMKNAGDNLILGCEDSKCDEWPKVGDEVEFPTGRGVLIVSKPDEQGIVIVKSLDEDFGNVYKRVSLKAIKKPKTSEEELRDDIIELTLGHMENKSHPIEANAYYLFSDLMSKYNITKKPQ